jgi:hypothetical protein
MSKSVMSKEEFKERWESNDSGGGITTAEIAECAKEWGLFETPRVHPLLEVVEAVCEAAGVKP